MSAWVTIYLRQIPKDLTSEQVKKGISPADWWTLGEDFGIKEDAVDSFMGTLQWGDNPLHFGQAGQRPVQFHLWTKPERVKEEIAEVASSPAPVCSHLAQVQAVIALELGISQLETLHEIVAFEVAYWLAETYQGLIHAPDGNWYDHADHRWEPIE